MWAQNLCFGANPQKYQTLAPAKNSHLKVTSTNGSNQNPGHGMRFPMNSSKPPQATTPIFTWDMEMVVKH